MTQIPDYQENFQREMEFCLVVESIPGSFATMSPLHRDIVDSLSTLSLPRGGTARIAMGGGAYAEKLVGRLKLFQAAGLIATHWKFRRRAVGDGTWHVYAERLHETAVMRVA